MADNWINVSDVTTGRDHPDSLPTTINVGLWHNYSLYTAFARSQELGFGWESNPKWIAAIREAADTQYEGEQRAVLEQIADALETANPDGPISTLTESMQAIFSNASTNPDISQSAACLVASVAYRSSQFWPEVTIANTGARLDPRSIIHIIAADIVGAVGGAGTGAALGGVTGAVIVGAIGGVAASVYTATEPPAGGGGG